jgi:agrin, putative
LDQPLFIGAVDNISSTHKESGISRGLNGAIQRIIVNGEVWDDLVSQALKQHNVGQYSGPPCGYQNPCPNGTLCIPHFQDFECKCMKSKCPPFNST